MGLMLISFSYPHRFKFHCLVECRHRFLGGICQHTGGRRGINRRLACDNSVRDQRLVSVDGDVLHNDLLLAPTSMLVERRSKARPYAWLCQRTAGISYEPRNARC